MRQVYLYLFERGMQQYRRAASVGDVLALGNVWQASAISHTEPEMSGESERDAVKVTLPLSDAFASEHIRARPDGAVLVTIYSYNRDAGTAELEWSGRLSTTSASGSEAVMSCEPETSALAGAMLPIIAMRQCPHHQYTGKCRLNFADFRHVAPLLSVAGPVVTVEHSSVLAGLQLAGGIIEASDGSTRKIKSYNAGVITITRPLTQLAADAQATAPTVNLVPTCGNSPDGCATFVNAANASGTNIENYGGHLWMMTGGVNPFGGSSVI